MKLLFFIIITLSFCASAKGFQESIQEIFQKYQAGQYQKVIEILDTLKNRVKNKNSEKGQEIQGLIAYWRGMSHARLNEFDQAEKYFLQAIRLKYDAKDVFYEYGQVLYVSEKYKRARIAFKKSVKKKYKVGVSLYYIGFISQELKEYKKAVSFYNLIEKLPKEEKDQVVQAARMQIGDVYLKQVERQPDIYNGVRDYVLPQYRKALEWNEESSLASTIKDKIEGLQRKYELILFRMRNGRLTARPPYFLRFNGLYGINDNVRSLTDSDKSSESAEDVSSAYYTAGAFGRYSIYPSSSFSYTPEFTANYTRFLSDSNDIKPFNGYFYTAALRTNYEFLYNDAAATIFTDFDYTYTADDADADDTLEKSNTSNGVTLSSQLEFFKNNPSTFRLRYATTDAVDDTGDFNTTSFGMEQIYIARNMTLFFFGQYANNVYDLATAEASNNNALTMRFDFIFSTVEIVSPTLYFSIVNTDYFDDSSRAATNNTTYGINIARKLTKKYFLTLDYSLASQIGDEADTFSQSVTTLNIDYIY